MPIPATPIPETAGISSLPASLPATPMMRQYSKIRNGLPDDVLLFFRLGDFYELFGEDAQRASAILGLTLTKRSETPMCGVPFHAADNYIAKLIEAKKRVAICDQKGEVRPGQLVEREITRIISAGTVTDVQMLNANCNNYLAATFAESGNLGKIGFAFIDLTTGEFKATELPSASVLLDEIARINPSELLISSEPNQKKIFADISNLREYEANSFDQEQAEQTLIKHLKVHSLDGFGFAQLKTAICAAGAILHYLSNEMRRPLSHVLALRSYSTQNFLILDATSQNHLEIAEPRTRDGISLRQALDRTVTNMGARQFRNWLLFPLRKVDGIVARQDFIAELLGNSQVHQNIRTNLKRIPDLERSVSRLTQINASPRDLGAIKTTLENVPNLKVQLELLAFGVEHSSLGSKESQTKILRTKIYNHLHELPQLLQELSLALNDELPATTRDGGIFKDSYHHELAELRSIARDGQSWIAQLQEKEAQRTGIRSLKIKYNSVFGYYIEVTKSNLASVPENYHRKQTTANAERFITPELKEMETRLLGAEERAKQLEIELFSALSQKVLLQVNALQETATSIGALDVLGSLAEIAKQYDYCRPEVSDKDEIIHIIEGRHPVLDQQFLASSSSRFVPNDVLLDGNQNRLNIITGPNMAGKSTFLRQTAVLVLLAQIGSYIPAKSAKISLVDRIFTRVGANDDMSKGQSTFLVEMNETSNIVHHATSKSLVILDEIGRGTSTYDGLSIAWSVAEYLLQKVKSKTLFATHYHELTELASIHDGAQNYTVSVKEWNDEIVFLHRIVPGAADRSYGLQVARLAGLPAEIINRAQEILSSLESSNEAEARRRCVQMVSSRKVPKPKLESAIVEEVPQLSLFG